MTRIRVAVCTLSQWAGDLDANQDRILKSIHQAQRKHCRYRLGPELEITGYGAARHYQDRATLCKHALECLADILQKTRSVPMLIDTGLPILFKGNLYNCRAYCLKGKLLLLRPKLYLAKGEEHFTRWPLSKVTRLESYPLPAYFHQTTVPFGVAIFQDEEGTRIGSEICEELFVPHSLHQMFGLQEVDFIANGSASHYETNKHAYRRSLLHTATKKHGMAYLYANLHGFDGGDHFFDGGSAIWSNGICVKEGDRFRFKDVEVLVADIDRDSLRKVRKDYGSLKIQAKNLDYRFPLLTLDGFSLSR